MITNYGYIYRTTNTLNNKVYTGQKKGNYNAKYFGSGKRLDNAIKKYGRPNIRNSIITWCFDKNHTDKCEKYWIKESILRFGRDNAYNISEGGDGGNTTGGTVRISNEELGVSKCVLKEECDDYLSRVWVLGFTQQTKQKMKDNHYDCSGSSSNGYIDGRSNSKLKCVDCGEEIRYPNKYCKECLPKYLSKLFSGDLNPMFGRHHTDEAKESSRLKHLGKSTGYRWIYNKESNESRMVCQKECDDLKSDGWIEGLGELAKQRLRKPRSEEGKAHMRKPKSEIGRQNIKIGQQKRRERERLLYR